MKLNLLLISVLFLASCSNIKQTEETSMENYLVKLTEYHRLKSYVSLAKTAKLPFSNQIDQAKSRNDSFLVKALIREQTKSLIGYKQGSIKFLNSEKDILYLLKTDTVLINKGIRITDTLYEILLKFDSPELQLKYYN